MNEFTKDEPRYHIISTGVVDRWENKIIDALDMIVGHGCSWSLPERFINNYDGVSIDSCDHDHQPASVSHWGHQFNQCIKCGAIE